MTIEEKPLITFALFAYNQERFIGEAVKGAFSQTYTPLEIILSDDCSSDRTFEIIQGMAAVYQGPHTIIINCNEKNLGICGHVNRMMEVSHGDLIVGATGDDISTPERTAAIYRAWSDSCGKAFSLYSAYEMIDEFGNTIETLPRRRMPQEQQLLHYSKSCVNDVSGCTHAWHRKVFNVFGPLLNNSCEDSAIPPRSMLLGKVVYINKPLVKYRRHENNIYIWNSSKKLTAEENIEGIIFYLNNYYDVIGDVLRCINEYKGTIKDPSHVLELEQCISNILVNRQKIGLKKEILTGYPVIRLYLLLKYMYLYKLQCADLPIVVCAISKTAYRLSRRIRDFLRSRL